MKSKSSKLKIIIPTLSVLSIGGVVTTGAVLSSNHHIRFDFPVQPGSNIDGYLIYGPQFDMPFKLDKSLENGMSIYCNVKKLSSSMPNVIITTQNDGLCVVNDKDCLAQIMLLDNGKLANIQPGFSCNVDIDFKCVNQNNKIIWTQNVVQLCIRWL